MLQKEFEERTGISVSAEEFETIHNLYMNCGDMDKDEFCKIYKSKTSRVLIDTAVKDLTIANDVMCNNRKEIQRLWDRNKELEDENKELNTDIRGYEEAVDKMTSEIEKAESDKLAMMYKLIEISEQYSSAELRELVINEIGFRRYISYKLEHDMSIWALDRVDIMDNLKD